MASGDQAMPLTASSRRRQRERAAAELAEAADRSSDPAAPMNPVLAAGTVRAAFGSGTLLASLASAGALFDREPISSPQGLATTPDGLAWQLGAAAASDCRSSPHATASPDGS